MQNSKIICERTLSHQLTRPIFSRISAFFKKKRRGGDQAQHLSDNQSDGDGSVDSSYLIDLYQVAKWYETPAGPFPALKEINLRVQRGEFVSVIGKSGSGKSTLINMITGIDRPSLGEVRIHDVVINDLTQTEMARWRSRHIGIVFQSFQLLPTLTVVENVMMPMEFAKLFPYRERRERAMRLLKRVGLAQQADKFPAMLSGGQQQRVAIARALANDPKILVADEPTGSLDTKTGDAIFQLFEEFVQQGGTILMVTHDRSLASRASRVVFISDGEVVDELVAEALPGLSSEQQVQVLARLEPEMYQPGEVIIRQGDPADSFYIIVKGSVEVSVKHSSGSELELARLETGQYFGEMQLLSGGTRTATVRASADEPVSVMQLPRDVFVETMENSNLTRSQMAHLIRERVLKYNLHKALPMVKASGFDRWLDQLEVTQFQPGDVIVQQGDVAEAFYVITKGEAEVVHQSNEGGEVTVARLGVHDYFGEAGLIQQSTRSATVRVVGQEPASIVSFGREAFLEMVASSDEANKDFVTKMRKRLIVSYVTATFPRIEPDHAAELSNVATFDRFYAGDPIAISDKGQETIYIVAEGQIDLLLTHPESLDERLVAQVDPQEFFGGQTEAVDANGYQKRARVSAHVAEAVIISFPQAALSHLETQPTEQ